MGVLTFWLFAQTMLNIGPDVQNDLGISAGILNISVSITALFSGMFMVGAGSLADRIGRVKMTNVGMILSIIGSLCIVLAQGAPLLIIGRIIQGFSAAAIMPSTMALMKVYFDGKDRQRALSYWSIGSWGGSGLTSLFAGMVASSLGWRWIFILSIIVTLIGMFLLRGTPESKVEAINNKKFDFAGLFTFVIMMLSFNLYITNGSALGWTSLAGTGLIAVFIISTLIFIKIETGKNNSLVDFTLFKNKAYAGATLSNFLLNAAAGTLIVVNTYAQAGRGFSPFQTGLLTIGYLVFVLIAIRMGEKFLQKYGARVPMLASAVITAVGIALMSLTFLPNNIYIIFIIVGYALFGFGLGIYATPSTDTAVSNAPVEKVAVASGVYKMASSLGSAIGVAVSASVFTAVNANGHVHEAGSIGLLVNVLFVVIAFLSVFFTTPKDSPDLLSTNH
ncbi:MFS transporter [Desemzia sp. RIT804]|uniref:MFS transporter n=1 Tax=Desemzia sp. RIT 804 TaxID=2810209 RepID=UPI00194F2A4D|nr:MFS transporter [Desemzia sp. RIT 804]MBM6615153.1 MFS transporter [Desemzia sp. RIT 804]